MNNTLKLRMVSGIQPTNNLTLGNYLGAMNNFVMYQDEYEMFIFIADLHAITTNQNNDFKTNKINIVKLFLAAGLDPKKVVIFNQSDVMEHTLLSHILLCNTTIGELNRMTQFKDKSQNQKASNGTEFIPTGLLTYPVLMAADILLYDTDVVMVGADQKQHLELTRNLAERMNNKYHKQLFKVPSFFTNTYSSKIMDLQNPVKKMSKSSENEKGTIFLTDKPEVINKKIMSAISDNFNTVKYDVENQPGIANLINIYATFTKKSIDEIEKEFEDIANYAVFKKAVADVVCEFIIKLQDKFVNINDEDVIKILDEGSNRMKTLANKKMKLVLESMNIK